MIKTTVNQLLVEIGNKEIEETKETPVYRIMEDLLLDTLCAVHKLKCEGKIFRCISDELRI